MAEEQSVETVSYLYHGATYDFTITDGAVTDGTYTQPGKATIQLNNPLVTYMKVANDALSKKIDATELVEATTETESPSDISVFGVKINLSKIGIPFKLNQGQKRILRGPR